MDVFIAKEIAPYTEEIDSALYFLGFESYGLRPAKDGFTIQFDFDGMNAKAKVTEQTLSELVDPFHNVLISMGLEVMKQYHV